MTERETIESEIYSFLRSKLDAIGCNFPLVFERENGVRPKPPFFSISTGGIERLGANAHIEPKVKNGKMRSFAPVNRNMTIRGFGREAEEPLNEICGLIEFEDETESLRGKGIAIRANGEVVESASDYDAESEIFYSLDIVASYERVVEKDVGWIETVDIERI